MASGLQPLPQPAASKEVKSDPRLCGHPGERTNEMALSLLLPPPPWNISLPTATQRMFPEACQPGAARLPEPSRRRSRWLAAQTPRAAGPAAAAAPAPPPPSFGPERRMVPCDSEGLLDERRLVAHLKLALRREARLWRGGHPQQVGFGDTFQEVVLRLLRLENIFHFSQGTFNLALTIFRRLLVSVKIKERLLHCVTITSLRLAAKVNEEEELIPHIKDFIKHYGSGYTSNELLRMELAILDKLHWDLYIETPLDFLTIFHALVVVGWPHMVELLPQRNPSLHVASLTRQLQHCMAGHQLLQFKGSTLALVIITLELERLMPDWCTPISDLLKKAQVTIEQLVHCRALIKQQLRNLQSSSCRQLSLSCASLCPYPSVLQNVMATSPCLASSKF